MSIKQPTLDLYGTRLNRSISANEMEFIRGAKKISELNSRWDRIQDWFCGTKIVEAKSLLFALMHQSSEISKQGDNNEHFAQNFLSLRDLAAPTHRHKFTATVVNKTITFGIVDASIKFDVLRTALNKNTENALNIMCPTHNGRFFGSFKKNNQQKCQTQCIKLKGINATTLKTIDSNTTTKVRNDDQWVDTVTQDGYQRKRLLQLAIQNSLVSKGFQPRVDHDAKNYKINIEIEKLKPNDDLLVKVIHSIETKSDKIGNVKNHQQKNVVNDQIFCGTFIVGKSEIVCLDYTNDLSNPGNSKSTLNTDTVKGSPHLLMV